MNTSDNNIIYTTADIQKITGKTSQIILRWAREHNVQSLGNKSGKRYQWTETNLKDFQEYIKTAKVGRKSHKTLEETTNLDTLYHRLIRSKKKGNLEQFQQTRQILDSLKLKKNTTTES